MTGMIYGYYDCRKCEQEALQAAYDAGDITFAEYITRDFMVCSGCGSKRCPGADDHDDACYTGKNRKKL